MAVNKKTFQKAICTFIAACLFIEGVTGGALRCGEVLYAGEGKVQSPNHPGKYPSDVNCEWLITTEYTNHITLLFSTFELEESPGCHYDYLEIYDGRNANSPLIGKYCGMNQPGPLTSSSQSIFMKFISDMTIERLGFSVNYSTGCSRTFYGPSGEIMSPNYPSKYNTNLDCVYKIQVGNRKRVKLVFVDFWLENGDTRTNCDYDYLEIRDGRNSNSNLIGLFCGNDTPGMIVSHSNTMTLRFVTDGSVVERGFLVQYITEVADDQRTNQCRRNNGGCAYTCRTDNRGRVQCECPEGFNLNQDGRSCDDFDECQEQQPCAHVCSNTPGSYRCECWEGYQLADDGKTCEDINECNDNNGGCQDDCRNLPGSYYCTCSDQNKVLMSDGLTCEVSQSCRENNGECEQVCHERPPSIYCSCHMGFQLNSDGFNCSDVNECQRPANRFRTYSHHCNQQCFNTPGSYYCDCDDGFELSPNGRVCKDIDECSTQLNYQCDQKCTNFPGGYRCDCFPGWQKSPRGRCKDINECLNPPEDCHTCVNFEGGFECECRDGFVANDNSTGCVDINECQEDNGGCQQVCVNLPGKHECRCRNGFQGLNIDNKICLDIDECADSQRGPCDHFCNNLEGSFECSCRSGFYLRENQITCADINECLDNNGGCNQRCINTQSSWKCGCHSGFNQINDLGQECEDVDECAEGIDDCVTSEGAVCQNSVGNYTCFCPEGYETTDWIHCTDVNECEDAGLNICQQDCNNINGSFLCSCFEGYEPHNNTHCQDVNECRDRPCDHRDLCQNTEGSFLCACRDGYFLTADGTSCSDINECVVNNGECDQICINDKGSRRCDCEVGYNLLGDGVTCQDIDECEEGHACCNQMHNCLNLNGSYTCSCDHGFYVEEDSCTCLDIDECEINNGGCDHTCTNFPGGFECSCWEGFVSDQSNSSSCYDRNECEIDNGGCGHICTNYPGGYNCSCSLNFKLGIDQHSCRPCPTCENFEEMQRLILELTYELNMVKDEITRLQQTNIIYENRIRQMEDTKSSQMQLLSSTLSAINAH
ncbi:uncharacterized protein [Apostichopus japonicus]|uniref:uncharacterized protein isoform X1 n=1 Tax=Stichopus japonicus TaxID=307972 RepID=UPI003AB511CA